MLLLEEPPMSAFDNTALFREIGFEICGYPFMDVFISTHIRALLRDWQYGLQKKDLAFTLELTQRWVARFQEMPNLVDFDVIAICVDAVSPPISPKMLSKIRQAVYQAEKKKTTPIPILGINLNIQAGDIPTQAELYDGLFMAGYPFPVPSPKPQLGLSSNKQYGFRNQVITRGQMETILCRLVLRPLTEYEAHCLDIYFPSENL